MTFLRIPLRQMAITIIVLATCTALPASTVLYYQFTGTTGATAASITDLSGNLNTGTAGNYGGLGATTPIYSSNTVGPIITDGLGGPIINAANTSSLEFDNPGPTSGTPAYNVNAGGRVTATSNASLRPTSFTIEAFLRVEDLIQFAAIAGHERDGGSTWLLDNNPSGHTGTSQPTNMTLRARYDQQTIGSPATGGTPGFNQNVNSAASISNPNSILGDGWYHVAMTYDVATDRATLFVNYTQVGSTVLGTGEPNLVYNTGLFFAGGGGGGRGFDGLMDELRFSNSILTPTQFLYVVPEPGRALLLLFGGIMALMRRRR